MAVADPKKNDQLFVFDPLTSADRALATRVMNSPKLVHAMRYAWRLTLSDGCEHSFFIYENKRGELYNLRIWKGKQRTTDDSYRLEPLLNNDLAVASYHTHPGTYPESGYTDWADLEFNLFHATLGFIQTHYGLLVGRTGHRPSR